jgi:uncharacterized protein (DUF433 family)
MNKNYIEQRDEGYFIVGTRVSLDSVVYAFRRGASPESIQRSFPLLTLEQVYGAITFYLAHKPEIDAHLKRSEKALDGLRTATRDADPEFYKKLDSARDQLPAKQP